MPFDRAATLRNAEKLLRQGKLDLAIADYLRVVEDQPRDWNTANTLGDLYVRAGQVEKALEHFIFVADTLAEEGHPVKAAALYKKIIKLKPEHEHALLRCADLVAQQGLYGDARGYLNVVIDLRTRRDDARGAAQVRIIRGGLDPADYPARIEGAGARAEVNDLNGAVRDLREIATELNDAGRQAEAVEALRQAALLKPDDEGIRSQLFDVYVSADDFGRAAECATTVEHFKSLAESLELRERSDEAIEMLRSAARLDPDDGELRSQLARTFLQRGDLGAASEYLTIETAGEDPKLRLTVAEINLRRGEIEEGMAIARQLLEEDPARLEQLAIAGWRVAEQAPEGGFALVAFTAETWVGVGDWAAAAAAFQEFVTRVPNHIPALMRLVEICVDGGLEATMYSAQAHLADAYLAGGMAAEARFIAEDLVAREPWERANIDRFRRALVLLGEPDPEAVVAQRLSGESPFTSTDLNVGELPPFEPAPPPPPPPEENPDAESMFELADTEAERRAASRKPASGTHFQLSANAIDIGSLLGEMEEEAEHLHEEALFRVEERLAPSAPANLESVEEDMSSMLDDIKKPVAPPKPKPAKAKVVGDDLDGVFSQMRDEASKLAAGDPAQAEYERGLELRANGDFDGCAKALTAAAKSPKLRFLAASTLARVYKERGHAPQALEWFERASEAPAPSADLNHAVLFELAEGLEAAGEDARALAIYMELQAEAGSYKDVKKRVDRLTKAQARG